MNDYGTMVVAAASLLVFLSWLGWGWAAWRVLMRARRGNVGLLSAVGIGVTLAIGGVALGLQIVSVWLLAALTALGLLFAGIGAMNDLFQWRRFQPWIVVTLVLCGALFGDSVLTQIHNVSDDELAYFVFPRQMLQTGTLLAPFNTRRLGTYGGHAFLQAQILSASRVLGGTQEDLAAIEHARVLDAGLCEIAAAVLIWAAIRPSKRIRPFLATAAAMSFLLVPWPRVNSHSECSGALLFLALFQMLLIMERDQRKSWGVAILTGLMAAGAGTLRMNFAAAAGVAILLAAGLSRMTRRSTLLQFGTTILCTGVMLLPWALVLLASSNTPLFPLVKGNAADSLLAVPLPLGAHVARTFATLLYPKTLVMLLPLLLAVNVRARGVAIPMYAAGIVVTLASAWSYTQADAAEIYRYNVPILLACAYGTLCLVLTDWNKLPGATRCGGVLLLVAIPAVLGTELPVALVGASATFLWAAAAVCSGIAAWGIKSTRPRILLVAACAIAGSVTAARLAGSWGTVVAGSAAYIVCGLAALGWLARQQRSKPQIAARSMLLLMLFAITFFQWPFLTDHFSLAISAVIVGILGWMATTSRHNAIRWTCMAAISIAGLAVLPLSSGSSGFSALARAFSLPAPTEPADGNNRQLYAFAQQAIPPGERLFVIVQEPWRLDFRRNAIDQADYRVQFASPPPGIPVGGSLSALEDYLKHRGVKYVMLSRDALENPTGVLPDSFTALLRQLAATRPLVFKSETLLVIDIRSG